MPTQFNGDRQIINGTIAIADLSATGTPGATTYLRGDNTWSTPSGSGDPSYAPGSFTVVTGTAKIMSERLILTSSQRATIQGTGTLVII